MGPAAAPQGPPELAGGPGLGVRLETWSPANALVDFLSWNASGREVCVM